MRAKLAMAIGLGILALTFMIAIKITSLNTQERSRFLRDSVQSEVGLAKTNASLVSKNYAEVLTQAASLEESLRKDNAPGLINSVFIKGPFLTIALLEPADISGWNLRWMKNKTGRDQAWTKSDGKQVAKELPLAAVSGENIIWHRHLSKTGHALYTLIIQVEVPASGADQPIKMVALGTLNNQAFSSVVESFKSTTREVMVLDDKGHALAYTSQQYVGAPMNSHPMVEVLLNDRKVIDVGEYQDRGGDGIVGAYERVDESNLYVAVAQKLGSYPNLFSAQLVSLVGLAVASFLIAISLGFLLVRPTIAAYEYLQDLAIALGQGLPIRQPAHFADMPPVLIQSIQKLQADPPHPEPLAEGSPNQKAFVPEDTMPREESVTNRLSEDEKVKIYKEVASGLAMALKEPVNVILGQSQLARSKMEDQNVSDHYTAIEREARRVRSTVENLLKISGSEPLQLQREDLHEIVLSALKEVRPELEAFGVQVRKDLRPAGQVKVDANRLRTAIAEVLKNSVESMQDSADKELFLLIKDEGKSLTLMIQDTGAGISEQQLSKVFTPFYTTKSELEHKGLGLSVAKGIVESCAGKLRVDSSGPQGTRIVMEFPLLQAMGDMAGDSPSVDTPAEETTESLVAKIPGLEDKLPEINQVSLAGAPPLTGTDADLLPSAPSDEEDIEMNRISMLDATTDIRDLADMVRKFDDDEPPIEAAPANPMANEYQEAQAEVSTASVSDDDLDLISGEDDFANEASANDSEGGFTVAIRKPKVGSGE